MSNITDMPPSEHVWVQHLLHQAISLLLSAYDGCEYTPTYITLLEKQYERLLDRLDESQRTYWLHTNWESYLPLEADDGYMYDSQRDGEGGAE